MFFVLRIVFTILSAVCLAALVPAAMLFGGGWAVILLVGAGIFFLALLFCKQEQQIKDKQKELNEKEIVAPQGDFFHPVPLESDTATQPSKKTRKCKKKHKRRK